MSDYVTVDAAAAVWNTPVDAALLLRSNPPKYGTNRPLVVAAVSGSPALSYASDELKDDEEVVTVACGRDGRSLRYASERLKNTETVVVVALRQNGQALEFASQRLRNCKELVLVAIRQHGAALQYASDELKEDEEIVTVACKQSEVALRFASERLRNTKEIVLVAVTQNGYALKHASDAMKNCIDVVCVALNEANFGYREFHIYDHGVRCRNILRHVGTDIREKITMFAAMINNENGILRSLDKANPIALPTHLKNKFDLRRVFLQPLCSGIAPRFTLGQKRRRDDSDRTIPHSLIKNIAYNAGFPVGAELRQLRLAEELMPIVMAYTNRSNESWASTKMWS